MSHPCIDVADAVVAELNAASDAGQLSQKVSAKRSYLTEFDLGNTDGVVIHVIARGISSALVSRAHDQDEVSVDVYLKRKVASTDNRDVDPLMNLVQELSGVLRTSLTTANAAYAGRASDPIYDPEALQQRLTFRSAVTYTYRKIHDVRI